jgi:DNA-nicking Smr family endonuclease
MSKTMPREIVDALAEGRASLQARLDLHGMTEAEAHARLVRFLRESHAENVRDALIITGIGRGEDGGALRRLFPLWLEAPPLPGIVRYHHTAHRKHGGEGAWYVRLKVRTPP